MIATSVIDGTYTTGNGQTREGATRCIITNTYRRVPRLTELMKQIRSMDDSAEGKLQEHILYWRA